MLFYLGSRSINCGSNKTTATYTICVTFAACDMMNRDAAKRQIAMKVKNAVFDAKRLIVRRFSDPIVQESKKHGLFVVACGDRDNPFVDVHLKSEKRSSRTLKFCRIVPTKILETAETFVRKEVKNAVVTCPAYNNDSQRWRRRTPA